MDSLSTLEPWQKVWREGFAPFISRGGLEALKRALEQDDPALIQGFTTEPPPLDCLADAPVEAACPIGFCGWHGDGRETVAQVEDYFAHLCFQADQALGEPAASRYFLNHVDDAPRAEMRRELLEEVNRALAAVAGTAAA